MAREPVRFGAFKSLNNKVTFGGLDTLSAATNVDISQDNIVRRRKGKRLIVPTASAHSLWSGNGYTLFVNGSTLTSLWNGTPTAIGSTSTRRHHYTQVAGQVYITDGASNWVLAGSTLRKWGVTTPPAIAAVTTTLHGTDEIRLVRTHIDPLTGIESAASPPVTLQTSPTGTVNAGVQPNEQLYATELNGDTYYAVPPVFQADTLRTEALFNRYAAEPPNGGSALCAFNGRIYMAVGNALMYSTPFSVEAFDVAEDFYQFEGRITSVLAVDGGLYVSADKLHFIGGDSPEDSVRITAYNARIIGASSSGFDDGNRAVFTTSLGICVGDGQGIVKNITEANVAYDFGLDTIGVIRHQDGMLQYIAFGAGIAPSPNNFTPSVGIRTIRRN